MVLPYLFQHQLLGWTGRSGLLAAPGVRVLLPRIIGTITVGKIRRVDNKEFPLFGWGFLVAYHKSLIATLL